ncbi:MAG: hypothetical protein WCG26_11545, partial [Chloroflexales bacterium]
MSDSPDALAQQIAALEATLKLPLPDAARRPLEAELARLCAARAVVKGSANVSGTVTGPVVAVNQGTIQVFFTAAGLPKPADTQRTLVARYLARVVETCDRLRLSGLVQR